MKINDIRPACLFAIGGEFVGRCVYLMHLDRTVQPMTDPPVQPWSAAEAEHTFRGLDLDILVELGDLQRDPVSAGIDHAQQPGAR